MALFDGAPSEEIDFSAEDCDQLLLHADVIEQAPVRAGAEGDEEVKVAVGLDVVAQERAEDGQFTDAPALAKVGDGLGRQTTLGCAHG